MKDVDFIKLGLSGIVVVYYVGYSVRLIVGVIGLKMKNNKKDEVSEK
jgi:hypothetical protein